MGLIKKAIIELISEMERQNKSEAVYYALNPGSGFNHVISFSETVDYIQNIEGDVDMSVEKIDIGTLRVLSDIL